jgi:hypothetical protein
MVTVFEIAKVERRPLSVKLNICFNLKQPKNMKHIIEKKPQNAKCFIINGKRAADDGNDDNTTVFFSANG